MKDEKPFCEQSQTCPQYDMIVVGGGISGLFCVRELLKKHPRWSIALAEKYKGLGGRTYSYHPPGFPGVGWEMGAGRVHKDHKMVMDLLKEYDLTWVPISAESSFQRRPGSELEPNPFEDMYIPLYFQPLALLDSSILANHTLKEIMNKVYGPKKTAEILTPFPYRAEVTTLRADLALSTFLKGGTMSSHKGYGVIKEGFGELVARMRADIEKRGCTILQRHQLLDFQRGPGEAVNLKFAFGYPEDPKASGIIWLRAEKGVVLALHKDAVAELPPFRRWICSANKASCQKGTRWKSLHLLKTQPLLRVYAVFPTIAGKSWFAKFPRIVTPERPRYIIPIDAEKGVVMISYTDADDTAEYMHIQKEGGDRALEKIVMQDVRRLFPSLEIPDPLFFRSHPWETGATYWLPGSYDPYKESLAACHPLPAAFPSLWLCGESWSTKQAWVEGALEHTAECLKKIE
jgi:hypothetical protein